MVFRVMFSPYQFGFEEDGDIMKYLSLLTWVGQFGFSCLFPTCVFLLLGVYLQQRFSIGVWIVILLGSIGFLTSISTARACLQSMRKEIDRISKSEHQNKRM